MERKYFMIKEAEIARKIRRMRIERGLTQQTVADEMGVTKGYISRIENSNTAPPVGTLISIAKVLGVDMNAIFDSENSETIMTLTSEDQRVLVARDKSAEIKYAHLAMKFPNRQFEPYLVTVNYGEQFSQTMQHKGQEFWFSLKGIFEVVINDEKVVVKKGDSLFFDSGYKHYGRCISKGGAEILLVFCDSKDD
jgi:transcriptional regulator with XRE-family HTH domain